MANSKQATKRAKQSLKHRSNNRWQLTRMRSAVKAVQHAVTAKNTQAEIAELFSAATSLIDKLANKGIIKKNKASRLKSRLNANIKANSAA